MQSYPSPGAGDVYSGAAYDPGETPRPMSSHGIGQSLQKEISYIIEKKHSNDLYVYNGKISDFEDWVTTVVDHLANSNTKFRGLMDWIRKSQHSFTKEGLMHSQIDGFNTWEIALELGIFTWRWLNSDIKDLRQTLCGHAEDLNGFELWKN